MAEEPRRSVRATKGQHTKSLDLLDQPIETPKRTTKKSKKTAAKEEEEEEEELIRCVCGAITQGDDAEEPWIACDKCTAWQHNVCVGISTYEDETPENYLCEQCGPQFHQELLKAVASGHKLWEDRRRDYEQRKLEEGQEKKKGKKKGKRASDIKAESGIATNGKAKSPSVPLTADRKETPVRSGSTKRKTRDESQDKDALKEPQTKVRKVSLGHATPRQVDSPPRALPVKITDLEESRRGYASLIKKSLLAAIPAAIKSGLYTLPADDTTDSKAERLAIDIQDAIHNTQSGSNAANQARAIFANLKSNQELCNGLLTKALSPATLAVMTTDDMASKEQKKESAELKAKADKQSIMVNDDGPRIRRTHKGEEVVGGDDVNITADETVSAASRRRSMLDPNAQMATRSRENSPGDGGELPGNIDDYKSHDNIRRNVIPKQPLNIETKPQAPVRKASTQDFDINKVFSSVHSPVNSNHNRRASQMSAPTPTTAQDRDPDIDKLLADDEGMESPPYSPAEYDSDPEIVWRGTIFMESIANFPAVVKHVAGADLSRTIPWTDILQKELKVAGRIDQPKANEYLCTLRYNPPIDVVVVNVIPTGEMAAQAFQELYDYFLSKARYGVLINKGVGNIRDTYLVPVPPSPTPLPDFLTNLEGQRVPEKRSDPILLIVTVIRTEYHAPEPQHFEGTPDVHSPSVMSHPQRQMSISGTGPAMSPINPQGAFQTPTPTHQSQPYGVPKEEDKRSKDQAQGEKTAVQILGQYVAAPTVAFLMPQAYQMRPIEWELIRQILEEDERSREDLQHLSVVLEERMKARGQN